MRLALAAAGILTKEEHEQIEAGLTVIEAEIDAGDFAGNARSKMST